MLAYKMGQALRGRPHQPTTEISEGPPPGRSTASFTGGYVAIPTVELVAVWTALQTGKIDQLDVRTWLAAREVAERRRHAPRPARCVYELEELVRLVGKVGEKGLRSSLRRLERLSLVGWTTDGPRFLVTPEWLAAPGRETERRMLALMPARRTTFPLPRRVLRLVAGGVKKSILASLFGHLLRCPHYTRAAGWNPAGTCKSSWVAEAFGISLRSAKAARAHLLEVSWLKALESSQWHQNRFGGRFAINLSWSDELDVPELPAAPSVGEGVPEFAPPQAGFSPEFALPESEQRFPKGIQTSELAARAAAASADDASRSKKGGQETPNPALARIVREDLRSVSRVMGLFDQALASPVWQIKGWTPVDTPSERLNWAAAARRAHMRGGTNPCGLFVHLVSRKLWTHVTQDDEEAVRVAYRRWQNPEPTEVGVDFVRPSFAAPRRHAALSSDASVLRRIDGALRTKAVIADAKSVDRELLRAGWTPARVAEARADLAAWKVRERALAELEG